mgnify:CR=1 FL=1
MPRAVKAVPVVAPVAPALVAAPAPLAAPLLPAPVPLLGGFVPIRPRGGCSGRGGGCGGRKFAGTIAYGRGLGGGAAY